MSLKHFNKTQVLSSYNKERIVFFISLIMMIISSSISVYAANYLYSSSEVSFDNSSSGISSDNVQGAIDELYQNASDYSSLESRIGVLEGHWKNGATSYFDAEDGYEWLRIVNSTTGKNRGISIHDSNDTKRGLLYFQPGDETVRLDARNSAGTAGQGKLNLLGNPVMVNGTSIGDMFIHRAVNADNLAVVGGGNISGNINASYSGYKPLIATCDVENASSSGSGSSGTVAYYCHLDGNKVFYWVHNHNSTQAKIKVNVFVLYVKN